MQKSIYIAYGSESGNAQKLAVSLYEHLALSQKNITLTKLNDVPLATLSQNDLLLIITSNFGDGEPPANAAQFFEQLHNISNLNTQFAVFGLGDTSYAKFCGFSIELDQKLRDLGATAIANRVDADISYKLFFKKWSNALDEYFLGNKTPLTDLVLQTKAYGEDQSFEATITSVKRINKGSFPAYDINIDISGSNMAYNAGDLLYVIPPVNSNSLNRIKNFYGNLTDEQCDLLAQKELRLLTKPLFRAIARKTGNADLKALTKVNKAQEYQQYIYGRDLADVLKDFCTSENLSVDDLISVLSDKQPRAYSIASCGEASPNKVSLCIREVNYELNNTAYVGTASHFLAHSKTGDKVNLYVRPNMHFHLPDDPKTTVIMIGSGVGIAPFLGFLQQERAGENYLFFGERHRSEDFLYQEQLQAYLNNAKLTKLFTAFSRDQEQKIYVQHILEEQGQKVWELMEKGAEIYLCGSKVNLGSPIDTALKNIAIKVGKLTEEQAEQWIFDLVSNDRFHKDLY